MDSCVALSIFLLCIGVGALSTVVINAQQIQKLNELLNAPNEFTMKGERQASGRRKSA